VRAILVLCLLVVSRTQAAGQTTDDDVPAGILSFVGGGQINGGAVSERYGWGIVSGLQAHYQPSRPGQTLSLGLGWSALFGRFPASDPDVDVDTLRTVEMAAGLRARLLLSERAARFVAIGGGGSLMHTNVPVMAAERRLFGGGYLSLGYQEYVLGRNLVSIDGRYTAMASGPRAASVMLGLGFGDGASSFLSLMSAAAFIVGTLILENV
jgi:hypothetical protein